MRERQMETTGKRGNVCHQRETTSERDNDNGERERERERETTSERGRKSDRGKESKRMSVRVTTSKRERPCVSVRDEQ